MYQRVHLSTFKFELEFQDTGQKTKVEKRKRLQGEILAAGKKNETRIKKEKEKGNRFGKQLIVR